MGFWTDSFPTAGSSVTEDAALPEWYQNYLQQLTGKAAAIADAPQEAYPGQRIAGFTDPQNQAFDLTQQNVGAWKPGMQQAGDLLTQSSTYDQGGLSQFMNPYTSSVVDEIGRLGNQNFTENLLPAANASFTGAGQFGSTRNQDAVGRAASNNQANTLGLQAQALNQGFNTANTNQQFWGQQGQRGAQQMTDQAKAAQALRTADVGALSAVGEQQKQQGQSNLDWAYNQFQTQQQQPVQNLSMLNSIIQGMALPTSTTRATTEFVPQSGTGQQLTGALTSMSGLFQ